VVNCGVAAVVSCPSAEKAAETRRSKDNGTCGPAGAAARSIPNRVGFLRARKSDEHNSQAFTSLPARKDRAPGPIASRVVQIKLWLAVAVNSQTGEDRLALFDPATNSEIGDYTAISRALEDAEARAAAADARAAAAEERLRRQEAELRRLRGRNA